MLDALPSRESTVLFVPADRLGGEDELEQVQLYWNAVVSDHRPGQCGCSPRICELTTSQEQFSTYKIIHGAVVTDESGERVWSEEACDEGFKLLMLYFDFPPARPAAA